MMRVFADSFYFFCAAEFERRSPSEGIGVLRPRGPCAADDRLGNYGTCRRSRAIKSATNNLPRAGKSGDAEEHLILPPKEDAWNRGLGLYHARQDKGWSLTDCISFQVMSEYGITDALTGDHHVVQAGFNALLA